MAFRGYLGPRCLGLKGFRVGGGGRVLGCSFRV